MLKKKRVIYTLAFALFFILIFLYGWSEIRDNERTNLERISSSAALSQSGIEKSLEYLAKDLLMGISSCGMEDTRTLREGEAHLSGCPQGHGGCYVMDAGGVLYMQGRPLDGKRVDSLALAQVRERGYAAAGLMDSATGERLVVLITPLETEWGGYLVRSFTGTDFLLSVTESVGVPRTYLCLFDEWGNLAGAERPTSREQREEILQSVVKGAVDYSYNAQKNAVQPLGADGYNLYFKTDAPAGWFYGVHVARLNSDAFFLNLPVSALIMLGILLLLLAMVVVLDVVNERETRRKLSQVGNADHLTGLVNSTGMQEAVTDFMQKHPTKGYSLVCMDIVSFSRINNMFGYSLGDVLLRVVADVVRELFFCGTRTNADDFVFLAASSEHLIPETEAALGRAIESRMGREYLQMITFKFGVYPLDGQAPIFRDVYEGALLALKGAKKQSGQSEMVYDERLQQNMELMKNIEVNMLHALSKEEFVVYVQPQVTLPEETCARGEMLIRWNSEFMGFMPPDKFIPVFESNGFIVETDFFMLTTAMELVRSRLAAGLPPVTLAVNQSKVTISFPNYFERLRAVVEQFPGVPLNYIELEITESTLENNWGAIVPLVHSMKKLGFSVAMDDFGSGFSSLNTLRILPIDILKIDKEFLQESDRSERCRIIIRNVIRMAKELDIKLICEGVETEAQLQFLKENGCDMVQGYFYSKPVPMDEFVARFLDKSIAADARGARQP